MHTIKSRQTYIRGVIDSRVVTAAQNVILKSFYKKYYTPSIGTIKKNVIKFTVGVSLRSRYGKKKCLKIHWIGTDGIETLGDINQRYLAGYKRTRDNDVISAMRFSIDTYTLTFKYLNETTNDCHPKEKIHVDHAVSMKTLIDDFLNINNNRKKYNQLIVKSRVIVNDDIFVKDWISYHQNHAKLQLLSATENIKKGYKDDIINGTKQYESVFIECPNCTTLKHSMNKQYKCKRCGQEILKIKLV
jgi:hypothetical protein